MGDKRRADELTPGDWVYGDGSKMRVDRIDESGDRFMMWLSRPELVDQDQMFEVPSLRDSYYQNDNPRLTRGTGGEG